MAGDLECEKRREGVFWKREFVVFSGVAGLEKRKE